MRTRYWMEIIALVIAIILLLFGDNLVQQFTGCSIGDLMRGFCSPPSQVPAPSLSPPIVTTSGADSMTSIPTSTETSLVIVTPNITTFPTQFVDSKGIPMVLISARSYSIGSNKNNDEQPIHIVFLNNYYIDQYEVTNVLYATCVKSGTCIPPKFSNSKTRTLYYENSQYDQYPVVYTTWEMAKNYCENWRGGRLPTEAEWEVANRGVNNYNFPWGNEINCDFANYSGNGTTCVGDTTPVGKYENGKGIFSIYDMAGNVSEWVMDWYEQNYYSNLIPESSNPQGPSAGSYRVIRGGSWQDSAYAVRSANRNWQEPSDANYTTGFRCVFTP